MHSGFPRSHRAPPSDNMLCTPRVPLSTLGGTQVSSMRIPDGLKSVQPSHAPKETTKIANTPIMAAPMAFGPSDAKLHRMGSMPYRPLPYDCPECTPDVFGCLDRLQEILDAGDWTEPPEEAPEEAPVSGV